MLNYTPTSVVLFNYCSAGFAGYAGNYAGAYVGPMAFSAMQRMRWMRCLHPSFAALPHRESAC